MQPFDDDQTDLQGIGREKDLAPGAEFSSVTITPNRGLAIVNHGDVIKVSRWHAADKDEFATKLTMGGTLPITRKYVDSVLASKPVAYWRFESDENGLIDNEIENGGNLKIVGNLRLTGGPDNFVAELGRPGSNGFLLSQETLNLPATTDYSTELWIKPSHVHNGSVMMFLSNLDEGETNNAAFYLQLLNSKTESRSFNNRYPGRIRYLHRDPPGHDSSIGTSCFSEIPYSVRRWQHVVTTKERNRMRLFIDGALVATGDDPGQLTANLSVLIGQGVISSRVNPFIGQLDELAIYDRALSLAEITERLNKLNWKQSKRTTSRSKDS
jgi:hypothetical protein